MICSIGLTTISFLPKTDSMATSIALRWTLEPSGLFDTESSLSTIDVSTKADILKTAVDQADLFPMLRDIEPIEGDLLTSPGSDVMGDVFFDAFTDLSGLLSGEASQTCSGVTVFDEIACQAVPPSTNTPKIEGTIQEVKSPKKRKLAVDAEEDDNEFKQEEKKPRTSTSTASYEKYRERRDKNNHASRKSREARKAKDSLLEKKAEELEQSNIKLQEKIEELTKHTDFLRKKLIETLSTKNLAQKCQ
ncbi:transcription factor ces-2-like [Ptychodera flava]|uniref:transcription factor ces-2-like n=1 Tax=Ptychodera flava TaxID=63121 RepID=UPI00396A53C3